MNIKNYSEPLGRATGGPVIMMDSDKSKFNLQERISKSRFYHNFLTYIIYKTPYIAYKIRMSDSEISSSKNGPWVTKRYEIPFKSKRTIIIGGKMGYEIPDNHVGLWGHITNENDKMSGSHNNYFQFPTPTTPAPPIKKIKRDRKNSQKNIIHIPFLTEKGSWNTRPYEIQDNGKFSTYKGYYLNDMRVINSAPIYRKLTKDDIALILE